MTIEERWAKAELTLDVQSARRIRRTPAVVIAITALLIIAVAITAAVDLRRLQTPRGAALAWTEAAVFGNCRAFLALSEDSTDTRTDARICADLHAATAAARDDASRFDVRAVNVARSGPHAAVTVEIRTPDGTRTVTEQLVRRGGDWLVVRRPGACGDVACY